MFKAQEDRNTCVFRRLRRKGQDLGTLHEGSLQKAMSEHVRDTCFFTLHEGSLQKLILEYVRYVYFKQVGSRSNTIMKL